MRGEWWKQTYAYKVFSAGMSAYVARVFWRFSARHAEVDDPHHAMGCQFIGFVMAMMAIFQGCINIGLIGDMWDKKRR
eukprot:CAMPEP_0183736712 /NCGR_PEP_ID=MMETSP0737-20130205/50049_1 /TAXON_ID=385413 /ORGANISM="Thalassiosira miniscula, Strain CCMP1093" /LENGTH=77 /DNA_ID=CAMNT_0025970789 /DNA_START=140 /DNA_END=373 /DNA_ORIENTATION=-